MRGAGAGISKFSKNGKKKNVILISGRFARVAAIEWISQSICPRSGTVVRTLFEYFGRAPKRRARENRGAKPVFFFFEKKNRRFGISGRFVRDGAGACISQNIFVGWGTEVCTLFLFFGRAPKRCARENRGAKSKKREKLKVSSAGAP